MIYQKERYSRLILAAPSVGLIFGSYPANRGLLADRRADGLAFPGECLVRIPRRFVRDRHGAWLLSHSRLAEAESRSRKGQAS